MHNAMMCILFQFASYVQCDASYGVTLVSGGYFLYTSIVPHILFVPHAYPVIVPCTCRTLVILPLHSGKRVHSLPVSPSSLK